MHAMLQQTVREVYGDPDEIRKEARANSGTLWYRWLSQDIKFPETREK